jgi:hypothetical protein
MKTPLIALSFLSLLFPLSAQAGTQAHTTTFDSGSSFASFGAGIVIPQSTSETASGAITGSGQLHFKDGVGIDERGSALIRSLASMLEWTAPLPLVAEW